MTESLPDFNKSSERQTVEFIDDARYWLIPALQTISEILALPTGWNSYKAKQIDTEIAMSALKLLLLVMSPACPLPSFVPTARGSIQLEWHIKGVDLEICFLSSEKFDVYFKNCRTHAVLE